MTNHNSAQSVIAQLFETLESGNLERFLIVLNQLEEIAISDPNYGNWYRYFEGVRDKEHNLDWARAERVFSALLDDESLDSFLRGQVLLSLANTYFRQGLWDRTEQFAERARQLFQILDTPEEEAKAWLQIAIVQINAYEQGDSPYSVLQIAVEQCETALALLETVGPLSARVQTTKSMVWNSYGLAHRSLRNWTEAKRGFQQFLQISQELENVYYTAFAFCNLGEVYQRLGIENWQQAHDAYRDALAIFQEFADPYQEIEVLTNLGYLHQEQCQYELALDYYEQTFKIIERVRAGNTSEETRSNFFATVTDAYANAVLICVEQGQAERAFAYVEQARSRSFLDFLVADSPKLTQAMVAEPLSLSEIQASLPKDALLLEYFTTGVIESSDVRGHDESQLQRRRFPTQKTLVFAVTRDHISVYDTRLSPNDLYPNDLEAPVEELFLSTHMRRMLYKFLMQPCQEHVDQARVLYMIPHGPLHYVPFQSLLGENDKPLLRPAGPQIIYAPSATILLRHKGRRHASHAKGHTGEPGDKGDEMFPCLAVGANGGSDSIELRFAEEEARAIAQLVNGRTLLGNQAHKIKILEESSRAQLLHFSCHGTFNPESPLESALHLAHDQRISAQEVIEKMHLRCDLVTLSACESGLSRIRRGDELFGLVRAFMYAGAPALIVTQWRVDERSTHILMRRFYEFVQSGMNFAEALRQAQLYLKNLSQQQVQEILEHTDLIDVPDPELDEVVGAAKGFEGGEAASLNNELESTDLEKKIFAAPYYWAPFILIGDDRLNREQRHDETM